MARTELQIKFQNVSEIVVTSILHQILRRKNNKETASETYYVFNKSETGEFITLLEEAKYNFIFFPSLFINKKYSIRSYFGDLGCIMQ